ncbi:MAG: rod shape-determining protein MreD, partial [Capsulimonadales bacterium]|nr:rod shape-determining protein MreD [Capsulimonadales bacterium]
RAYRAFRPDARNASGGVVHPVNTEIAAPRPPALLFFLLLLLIAAGLQSTVAGAIQYRGAHPDIVLTVALSAALLSDASVGCLTGVVGGLISGSVVGKTLGTFLISRALAGYLAGAITTRLYRGNAAVILLGVFIGSVAAETIYGFSVPRLTLSHWIGNILLGAAMNALLALPMSFLLHRFGWGNGRL